ncbi:uncharacterized protein LOC114277149 [Camellia sinensis]|uniref:uncharacterized protein LOC114277149 n=1 Tax=Camellia sinensis TaxID=4442 RepID=UPI001035936F|nr:uncharacterized protein LOC114277149 [Camellia sinensis]
MVQTKQSKRRILIIGSDVLMKKLSIKAEWKSDLIRYAFELLKNPLWKRNYDIFGIDEHIHVLDSIKERHAGTIFSEIDLPLLESASFDLGDHDFEVITSGKFLSKFENSKALLIQVFSFGSNRSAQFSNNWKKIASLLDGMANTGMVELGEVQLATYLAEKTFTGQPSFQNGLPSLIAFPSGCNTANCLISYKVLWEKAVLIRFGVESAPAIVFLKEHGVKPVVYHGPANNSWFVDIMEQNKHQELPQLRSVTSMELGCHARGYSRAGNVTAIWYCVILSGRSSPELNKMRATLRRIQEALSAVDNDQPSSSAAVALKEKRLTFTWLDGEAQQRAKTPALVPEDADPIWSVGAKTILSKGTGMKQRIGSIMNGIHNRLGDPRIGPVLLLGALMSFGGIWLRRSQSTHPSQSNNKTQLSKKVSHGRLCSWEHCHCYFLFQLLSSTPIQCNFIDILLTHDYSFLLFPFSTFQHHYFPCNYFLYM